MKKLEKRDIEDILSLTPMQEGILFHYLQAPGSEVYFEQLTLEISGKIDLDLFKEALDFVIENNDMLRTLFRWERLETPLQIILKKYNLQLGYYDFTKADPGEMKKQLEQLKNNDRKSKFQLKEVPFRVILCKVKEYKYVMIVSNHHILYDGWSIGIILNEFFTAYHDLANGKKLVKSMKTKFRTFIQWLQDQDLVKQERFWRNYLKNFDTQTGLPVKSKAKEKEITLTCTKNCQVRFEKDMKDKLEGFVKEHRITLAALLYSAWGILLQEYNNIDDVVFGTTVSGRAAKVPYIEDMVGLFINTIPLRIQTLSHEKTEDLLYRIDNALQMREKYETTSLVKIREYSDFAHNEELFDSIVVVENYPLDIKLVQGNNKLFIESYSMVECTHYDLTIRITIADDIEVTFSYNKELFDRWTIERLSGHFVRIVQCMTKNHGEEVSKIELMGEEEKRQILIHFNRTGFDYPGDKRIDELFAEQVSKIPDYMALVGKTGILETRHSNTDDVYISYRELNEQSNQLACALREKGAAPDAIVGIMLERSIEMIVGILAILKSGGAYLPIDPVYPEDRIVYMLAESKAKVLVTTSSCEKLEHIHCVKEMVYSEVNLLNMKTRVSTVTGQFPVLTASPTISTLTSISRQPASAASLAYVIYTSGSTGKPKGVMVEHRNVNYLAHGLRERIYKNYGGSVKVCLVSPFVFDASVKQIFGALLWGNCLCIVPEEARINGEELFAFYKKHRVDISDGTPAHLQLLMENKGRDSTGVRDYLIGGEPLSWKTADGFLNRFSEDDPGITNVYGPTECTVDAASYQVNHENIGLLHRIPIGNPLPNCRIYVLARRNKLQPIGVPGELCIMGKGVSRGYLNRPELTAEKFIKLEAKVEFEEGVEPREQIPNPRPQIPHKYMSNMSYMYKTGDLGRWLSKGDIEFMGRLDQQMKIRGHRIELGEIEHQLFNYPAVKEAVVAAISDGSGNHFLCAYFVSQAPGVIEISQLRNYLHQKLPDYMIPAYFVNLEEIPLTGSGKVDRKSLPQPGITSSKRYVMPGNEIEGTLVDIWTEILEIDKSQIGIDDNFFELGGHSLKFTGLIGRIHKKLNIKVPFTKIFKIPTIRELAEYIRKEKESEKEDGKILPMEKKEYYRLSSAQRRLFVLQQMDSGCTAYNITGTLRVEGKVEKEKFAGVFIHLIRRHESLRTSFHMVKDQPVQQIHDKVKFEIEYDQSLANCQARGEVSSPTKVEKIIRNFIRPFVLSRAPLMRVGLIKEENHKYILIVDMHHIISDGLSMEIFVKDFGVLINGGGLPLVPVIRYKDYAEWECGKAAQEQLKNQREYWSKQFEGEVPVLMLPIDFSRPVVQDFAGHTLRFELAGEQTQALKAVALKKKTTLNVVLLTLYTIFLSKITGQEDIVVGIPSLARPHVETETIIGMFANSLALRNFPRGETSIGEFITEVKARTLEAFANQDYPYESLVETLVNNRDTSRNPLFDTMFVFQDREIKGLDIPGLGIKSYEYEDHTSKFDLTLLAFEGNENLFFAFEYGTNLFKKETIERFIHYFKTVVSYLPGNINRELKDIELITGKKKRQILEEFNDTATRYSAHKPLHELFAEQVEQTPESIALLGPFKVNRKKIPKDTGSRQGHPVTHSAGSLSDTDTFALQLTYNQLNREADQLALVLKEKGVLKDTIIAIKMERSIEMIVGIMGILKAGAAYLPIDPDYPEERIKYMLKDSNASFLVTTPGLSEKFEKLLIVNELAPGCQRLNRSPQEAKSTDLAYVIYTSGSTGKPKGVSVEHFSVVNLALCQGKQFDINERDRILQFSSICFDASVEQIFIAFFNGAVLVLVDKNTLLDQIKFEKFMICQSITHIHAVPSFLNGLQLKDTHNYGLKRVIAGGDVCPAGLAERWSADYNFYNEYGPTETTVTSIEMLIETVDKRMPRLPVGKPISNTQAYVLDKWMNLVPIGVGGDLYLGGAGVARGYLNKPELTKKKFVPNFLDCRDYHDVYHRSYIIYKTGDLARWLPEGNIEFLGRKDSQVKIRGFRIELGEIEAQLLQLQGIHQAVVVTKEDKNRESYICAYVVSDEMMSEHGWREYLLKILPGYMVPSCFVRLEALPLTSSGKVDRKSLPEPIPGSGPGYYAAPRDEIEMKLVDIWSAVLGIEKEKISINGNFFELGGHSLKAAILISKLHRALNIELPLTELFKRPTIEKISHYIQHIKGVARNKYTSLDNVEEKEYYELSSAQKRLFILEQTEGAINAAYNLPGAMLIEGELDIPRIETLFNTLITRHDSFRTSFDIKGEKPVQIIHDTVVFKIQYSTLTDRHPGGETLDPEMTNELNSIVNDFIKPFDLGTAPLLRVALIGLGRKKHLFLFDMHHIISDGVSSGILVREFVSLYEGNTLPVLQIQYKDFSEWQNKRLNRNEMKKQEDYWLNRFRGDIPILNMPTDYPRQSVKSFEGSTIRLEIDRELTGKIREGIKETGTTLYMILLAIFNILLSKYTGQEDIIVGVPAAARSHPDLENIIGMFVNSLALRNYPRKKLSFGDFLQEVKENVLKAFENQDHPFEELVNKLGISKDYSRNPLFDVLFVSENLEIPGLELKGLTFTPFEIENRRSHIDLVFYIVEADDTIVFRLEYASSLFGRSSVEGMLKHYAEILKQVVSDRSVQLEEIDISQDLLVAQTNIVKENLEDFGF